MSKVYMTNLADGCVTMASSQVAQKRNSFAFYLHCWGPSRTRFLTRSALMSRLLAPLLTPSLNRRTLSSLTGTRIQTARRPRRAVKSEKLRSGHRVAVRLHD